MSGTLILKTKIPFKIGKKSLKFLVTCDTRKIEGDDDVTEIILNEGNGIIRGEIETKEIDKKYLFSEVVTSYDADKISSYPVTFATEEGLMFIYNSLIDKSIKNCYIVLWRSVWISDCPIFYIQSLLVS